MKADKLRKEDRMEIEGNKIESKAKTLEAEMGKNRKDIEIFLKDTLIILKCEDEDEFI